MDSSDIKNRDIDAGLGKSFLDDVFDNLADDSAPPAEGDFADAEAPVPQPTQRAPVPRAPAPRLPVEAPPAAEEFNINDIDFGPEDSGVLIDEMLNSPYSETVIQGTTLQGPRTTSVRALTDQMRAANSLQLPASAGQRVAFITNVGSILTYTDPPDPDTKGTVVACRTSSGHTTAMDSGHVFVAWDDGKFRPILAEHLRPVASKTASTFRFTASSLGDLSQFFASGRRADELVHKATKDLWSLHREGDRYVVERLFDDTGKPLKV